MTKQGPELLAYAVRPRVILKFLGELCLSLTGVAAVPLVVALAAGQPAWAGRCALAAAILLVAGIGLSRLKVRDDVQVNEALVVITLGYAGTAALMSWPFMASGLSPLDALFHAVSAITTTGLSTLDTMPGDDIALRFTQAWMQWYGGLVIVVLAAAIILEPGVAAKQLGGQDTGTADFVSGTRARARIMLIIYAALTASAFLIVWAAGAAPLDALMHVLAGVSTGGFSSRDAGLAGFESRWTQGAIILASFCGAVSFSFYYGLYRGHPRDWLAIASRNLPVLSLIALCLIVTGLLAVIGMIVEPGLSPARLLDLLLLAISAQTTTGFSPVEVGAMDPASKLILATSMAIGGDAGSTAGGIKVFRLLLILHLVRLILLRTALTSRAVTPTMLGRERLDERELQTTIGLVSLYLAAILGSWLIFLTHGQPALDALFEVVSATATTGLSTGLTGPSLDPALKLVLCLDMLMGRLEIVAVVILLYPRTWLGRRAKTQ